MLSERHIVKFPANCRAKNMTNERVGRLVVLGYLSHKKGRPRWLCKCDCGNFKEIGATALTNKKNSTKSCGCALLGVNFVHGESSGFTHRGEARTRKRAGTKEYRTWAAVISRCEHKGNSKYECYGARGIKIADEWRHDYLSFLKYIGRAPSKIHSLERINVNGNYEPGNVCWATPKMQANNRRNSRHLYDNMTSGFLSFGV